MGLFGRKNVNDEPELELIEDELTLFEMASLEDEVKKGVSQVVNNGWALAFAQLTEEEKREVVITKEQLSGHFINHGNKYYLKKIAVNSLEQEDEKEEKVAEFEEREFLQKIENQFKEKNVPEKYRPIIKEMLCSGGWNYYFLNPLIDNPDIQDIHVYAWDQVSVLLRNGVRYESAVSFIDKKDYTDFVSRVALRNKRGQSNNNAILKFTDNVSSADFKLRFDVLTEYVTSTGQPYIHIRKHPKKKYTVKDLYEFGAFQDERMLDFMLNAVDRGESMLFTGKNNSAKTTMLNALIDVISDQKNIFVVEDNEEISSNRGGIVYTHSVENKLEGKVTYSLSDMAEVSLLCDVDVVVVGEIKNDSAKGLMKAAYVGVQCFSTSHGQSAIDGYYKLADYVKQATTYELDDCLRFLAGFKNLIYMKNKKIAEVVVVTGLDESRKPKFSEIYNIDKGGWLDTVGIGKEVNVGNGAN